MGGDGRISLDDLRAHARRDWSALDRIDAAASRGRNDPRTARQLLAAGDDLRRFALRFQTAGSEQEKACWQEGTDALLQLMERLRNVR